MMCAWALFRSDGLSLQKQEPVVAAAACGWGIGLEAAVVGRVDVMFVAIARVEPDLFEAWGREPLAIHREGFAAWRIN